MDEIAFELAEGRDVGPLVVVEDARGVDEDVAGVLELFALGVPDGDDPLTRLVVKLCPNDGMLETDVLCQIVLLDEAGVVPLCAGVRRTVSASATVSANDHPPEQLRTTKCARTNLDLWSSAVEL